MFRQGSFLENKEAKNGRAEEREQEGGVVNVSHTLSSFELFQMMSIRCKILLSIFISTSLHVSGNYVPIKRRTHCICATSQLPIQSEKYQCHTDTVSSPDDGHIVARNM